MLIFWTLVIGAVLGYLYGHFIKPNIALRLTLDKARKLYQDALQKGNTGVYRTVITEHNQSSELTVEVQELAVTETGQVKVAYLSAFYKNPAFRTKKGEALLREVRELLGDYLPQADIEWYETATRQAHAKEQLHKIDTLQKEHFGT